MSPPSDRPFVQSLFVGQPETLGVCGAADPFDEQWTTGIFKQRVEAPVRVSRTNLAGDRQADLVNHGGPDKAICSYSGDHYPFWRAALNVDDFIDGAFGENFTLRGITEVAICIGDVWSVGDVVLQVSQPRQPCWKLARKWRIRTLTDQVVKSGRTGWYFRVLQEGIVEPGAALSLIRRPHRAWTVSAANDVMHHGIGDGAALAAIDSLSDSWKRTLARRAAR
jgi:MOSC domain-containing protein YiiM